MRLHLVFVGKTAFGDLESAIDRYVGRLAHYCRLETHYIKAEKITCGAKDPVVREREGERILKVTGRDAHLIAWDPAGRELDSAGFSKFLEKLALSAAGEVWMVVGGPVGLSDKLLENARQVLSLSKMTFPHDLARLMLVEQLYRAFTIIKGEPYNR
ncbi:MAG: 23S rRNA (pseudouridine(1915)-N(3))-methyltransferase RlmH [Syntrophobacteraceae bacterium]